jgi:mono/diheme cytochrome c family protein
VIAATIYRNRWTPPLGKRTHQIWNSIVLDGASARLGMPGFGKILTKDDVEAVRQYVLKRAHDTRPAAK